MQLLLPAIFVKLDVVVLISPFHEANAGMFRDDTSCFLYHFLFLLTWQLQVTSVAISYGESGSG